MVEGKKSPLHLCSPDSGRAAHRQKGYEQSLPHFWNLSNDENPTQQFKIYDVRQEIGQ